MEEIIGKTIDNYRIVELIGRGGMGSVYRAVDESLDRVVALKMLDPTLADDPEVLRRFLREPKLQAKLEHPNIVRIHAFRKSAAGLFMVMEYIDGTTLTELINSSVAMPAKEALRIFNQMLAAIEHAHNVNIIHRDIKPGNVLIAQNGIVKVTDFGLAKLVRGGNTTITHSITGTIHYMPPEQVRGLFNADTRSDIYSLGMTLYEMLAGRLPFDSHENDYQVLKAIIEQEFPSPLEFNSRVAIRLSDMVMTAIAKDPDQRFQTVSAFRDALAKDVRAGLDSTSDDVDSPTTFATAAAMDVVGKASGAAAGESPTFGSGTTVAEVVREAPEPPPPPPRPNGRKRGVIAAASILVLAAVSYALASLLTAPERTLEAAQLRVDSEPRSAIVLLNGEPAGRTPFEEAIDSDDDLRISVELEGHAAWSRTLNKPRAGQLYTFQAYLAPTAPTRGRLELNSSPEQAQVWLNGQHVGSTPYQNDTLSAGEHVLRLVKPGYAAWQSRLTVHGGENQRIHAPLTIAGYAEMAIRAFPGAEIFIDGVPQGSATQTAKSITTAAGRRKIRFRHERYGVKDFSLLLKAGENREVACYFEQRVNIQSLGENGEPVWGTIVIDGKSTNQSTPLAELPLGVGSHQITLKRQGYEVVEPPVILDIDATPEPVTHNLVFTLRQKTE